MPRKRKPLPPLAPPTDLPAVGVQITIVTIETGIAVDIDVRVADGLPGLERQIGLALRPAAIACGQALAEALGHIPLVLDPVMDGPVAASRPGRS